MKWYRNVGIGLAVALAAALALTIGVVSAQEDGSSGTAWLGVAVVETDAGVTVARVVSGSPADAADILIGDVIVSFNGTAIEAASDLTEAVQSLAPGDEATVTVLRLGNELDIAVTLGTLPTDYGLGRHGFGRGLFAGTTDGLIPHLFGVQLAEAEGGYEVTAVSVMNPLGFEVGDVITEVNGQAVTDLDWQALMADLAASDTPTLTITVLRDGEETTLEHSLAGGMFGFGMFGPGDFFGGRGFPGGGFSGGGREGRGGGFSGGMPGFQQGAPAQGQAGAMNLAVPTTGGSPLA